MAVPDFQPCWFDSAETGAPVLNNAAGALIALLDACLINGFNLRAISQIVVAGEVAVATSAAHGYTADYGKLLLISGASVSGLNGRVQPTSVTVNTFTYAAPGVPDGTYTGAISAKRPPLGWTKEFWDVGNERAIFKRSSPAATVSKLRVIDTNAAPAASTYAYATMVETATDIDTVGNEAPSSNANQRWDKGANSATAKQWVLVGDDLYFWFFAPAGTDGQFKLCAFGDPVALYPGDASVALLAFSGVTSATFGGLLYHQPGDFTPVAGGIAQIHHGLLAGGFGGVASLPCGPGLWGTAGLSGALDVVPVTGPYYTKTSTEVRSVYPGLYAPQGNKPFPHLSIVAPSGIDRRLLTVNAVRVGGSTLTGQVMIDLDGPWR